MRILSCFFLLCTYSFSEFSEVFRGFHEASGEFELTSRRLAFLAGLGFQKVERCFSQFRGSLGNSSGLITTLRKAFRWFEGGFEGFQGISGASGEIKTNFRTA